MHVVDLETTLARLRGAPGRSESLTHLELVEARPARAHRVARLAGRPRPAALESSGVPAPWTHQRDCADLAHQGRHAVVSTGTASGKSLCYLMPALHAIESARGPKGQRGARVLYLSPTKALAQDQLAALRRLDLPDLRCGTHDGDSTPEMREWTRDHAEYVLTNPDMLHRSLLPGHARWSRFFGALRYVVVDECHHYRGVFGAHVAQVLRRLRRVAALYGAHPTFVLASATVAEPEVAAGRLTGLDGRGRHRRRLASRPAGAGPVGAAVRARSRRERRAGAPLGDQRGGRPADRPGRRAGAHAGVRPVAPRGRDGGPDRPAAARRGGRRRSSTRSRRTAVATCPRSGGPWRRPCARAAARPGGDQRPRAGHRHQRARRRAARRLPRAPAPPCGSRWAGPAAAAATPWRCWSRATTRSTPTWSTIPRPCSASRSRPTSSTRTTPTSSGRTCARRPPSRR